jgi:hypothetical protein
MLMRVLGDRLGLAGPPATVAGQRPAIDPFLDLRRAAILGRNGLDL